ncbi:MAG: hypothetical protein ACRC4W_00845 [Treponemataceae bacterium]
MYNLIHTREVHLEQTTKKLEAAQEQKMSVSQVIEQLRLELTGGNK